MKRFILLLMVCVLAVSYFTGVYAEPEEQAVAISEQEEAMPIEIDEDAPLPIEQEQDTLELKAVLKINNDGSGTYTTKTFIDDATYEQYQAQIEVVNIQVAESGMSYALGEEGLKKYLETVYTLDKGTHYSVVGGTSPNGRFAINKGLFGTEYFASGAVDNRTSMLEMPVEEAILYAQVTIELPFPASYSNADFKENFGTKLTWNIYNERENAIEIKFTAPNYISLAILLVLIILAIVGVILYKKNKNQLTDIEMVFDALQHLEGETDQYVEDPFVEMTDDEIEEEIAEFVEEVLDEIQEEPVEEPTEEE